MRTRQFVTFIAIISLALGFAWAMTAFLSGQATSALAAPAQKTTAIITVCTDGPPTCDYDNVQAAVDRANTGDVTDSFDLSASGAWTPTLSVTTTGLLGIGQSYVFTLGVAIPFTLTQVISDTTTIMARSTFDLNVSKNAQAIITAIPPSPWCKVFLPVVLNNN